MLAAQGSIDEGVCRVSEPHLDEPALRALQEVMEDDYLLLLDTFLLDSAERLGLLRQGLAQGDAQALRLAAHSFKGSCSNMGAPQLAALCRSLEEQARRGQLEGVDSLLEQIERELAIVRILFKAERKRQGG